MTAPRIVRIRIVTDNFLTREMLCGFLGSEEDFAVLGEGDCDDSPGRPACPDVIVLDNDEIGGTTVRTVRTLTRACPTAAVVVLSSSGTEALLYEMLEAGARCFLHKRISRAELVSAIRGVASVADQITISVRKDVLAGSGQGSRARLSEREEQVLRLVAEAMTNRQIANALSITEGTVKRHLRSVFDKLGAVSRIDAVNRYRLLTGQQDSA